MAVDQAHLANTKLLRLLADSVTRLPSQITRAMDEIEADAGPRLRRIERVAQEARDELRRAEEAYNSLSEEDDEAAGRAAVDDARDRVAQIERAIEYLQRNLRRYKVAARALSESRRGLLAGAAVYLTERLQAIDSYLALQLTPGSLSAPVSTASNTAVSPAMATVDGLSVNAMTATNLPEGFTWIPIDQIIERDLPSSPLEWKKGISKQDMRIGLDAFRRDMLPQLARAGQVSRDDFVSLDRSLGRAVNGAIAPSSLANLYDVFFGQNSIAVDNDPRGGLSITNGRHRISVARELGWSHVPGRILGRSRP